MAEFSSYPGSALLTTSARIRKATLLVALFLVFSDPRGGDCASWEGTLDLPLTPAQSVPENAEAPPWEGAVNVLTVLRTEEDLGRQQAVELDRLWKRSGKELGVGIFSIDQVESQWPARAVEDFRRAKGLELPIFFLPLEQLHGVFKGYDPMRVRVLPQTLLFSPKGHLLRIVRGVRSAEELEGLIEETRLSLAPPQGEPIPGMAGLKNLLAKGDFEVWQGATRPLPADWAVSDPSSEAVVQGTRQGWFRSTALDLRTPKRGKREGLSQLVQPLGPLLGKKVRLVASAKSNSLGKASVVLATAAPQEDPAHRFVPDSPFRTAAGKQIPFRILAACDFGEGHAAWQSLSAEAEIPADARALAVLIYLDNPETPGGAALLDNLVLAVVE